MSWCSALRYHMLVFLILYSSKPTSVMCIRQRRLAAISTAGQFSPRIYMYNLPAHFQNLTGIYDPKQFDTWTYGAEKRIPEVLQNSGYITDNPHHAEYFYIPAWIYATMHQPYLRQQEIATDTADPARPSRKAVLAVLEYIKHAHPFWNRKNGTDHIWTLTQDHGFCGFDERDQSLDEIAGSIILSHWGLTKYESACTLQERVATFNHCQKRETIDAAMARGQRVPRSLPCFVPGKDIVVPPANWDNIDQIAVAAGLPQLHAPADLAGLEPDAAERYQREEDASAHAPSRQLAEETNAVEAMKVHRFFFAGMCRHANDNPAFSHGVRQAACQLFNNTPGFKVVVKTSHAVNPLLHAEMLVEMRQSHFCLAPTGDGWGNRLKLAVLAGCIPVVIQDEVQVAYENILPYKDFAIRLPQHMIFRLPEILDELLRDRGNGQGSQAARLRQRLPCAGLYLSWNDAWGRAAEVLACELRTRLPLGDSIVPRMDWEACQLHCSTDGTAN